MMLDTRGLCQNQYQYQYQYNQQPTQKQKERSQYKTIVQRVEQLQMARVRKQLKIEAWQVNFCASFVRE